MNRFESIAKPMVWFVTLLLAALTAGCGGGGGGGDPILGASGNAALAPTVTGVAPIPNAVGVGVNNTIITANFSEPMNPITGANFTVTCVTPCVQPTAPTISLDATNTIATFASAANLGYVTEYTATITGATSIATGLPLAAPYVWKFTTGLALDTVRPRVTATVPVTTTPGVLPAPGVATAGVATNTLVTATFNEAMAPATIISPATSFTLTCAAGTTPGVCVDPSPAGTVSYDVPTRRATFARTPAGTLLEAGKTYTATITTAATDIAGNALAGDAALPLVANDYVWTFITAAAVPPVPVTVVPPTKPVAGATLVCPSTNIQATFSVPMATVTTAMFLVTEQLAPFTVVTAATVALDGTSTIATFTPLNPLVDGTAYTATIKGDPLANGSGVKDLAIPANTMTSGDYTWNFTAGPATGACLPPVNPGALATFGIASFNGITNTGATTVNGDVVIDTGLTCSGTGGPQPVGSTNDFGPSCNAGANTITNFAGDSVITQVYPDTTTADSVMVALLAKWNSISPAGTPGATVLGCGVIGSAGGAGAGIGCAGNSTLPPGAYISASNSTIDVTGNLTLDGGGNADATWIFQAPSALNVNVGSQIILIGGAKASNVWWYVGSSATLFTNSIFNGNILASASITMQNLATSCGRLLAGAEGAGAFVFDTNVVSVPGHTNAPFGCE